MRADYPLNISMIKALNTKNLFLAAIAAVVMFGFASFVYANPFYTGTKAQTALATSTQTFMSPGNATTTPIYDSYEQYGTNQPNSGNITLADSVAVLLNGTASSSATVINIACEFSDNYVGTTGNGDWYQNEIFAATSSGQMVITTPVSFTFTVASSTLGGTGLPTSGSSIKFQKLFQCPVPLRYVRAVITNLTASTSVWAQIVPIKQRN